MATKRKARAKTKATKKVGRACLVCDHPKRVYIEQQLLEEGISIRQLALRFGMSYMSLSRHQRNHMEAVRAAAVKKLEKLEARHAEKTASSWVDKLASELNFFDDMKDQAIGLVADSKNAGKLGAAVMALGEARANVTEKGKVMVTLAKAAGEIQSGPNVVMNLVQNLDKSEAWQQLMGRIQTFAKHADTKHRELLKSAIAGKLEPQLVEGQVVDG